MMEKNSEENNFPSLDSFELHKKTALAPIIIISKQQQLQPLINKLNIYFAHLTSEPIRVVHKVKQDAE